jgi:peptide/nickel transport system substrate-binding protein
MKKIILIFIVMLLAALLLISCGKSTTTTSPTSTASSPSTSTTVSTPAETTPASTQPVYGGTLRMIAPYIPKNLGYVPEKTPNDNYQMLPVIERLCEWDINGNLIPRLAESWDTSSNPPSITWHLRKGVKFNDGSDWNAEAVRWNFQLGIDTKSLTDNELIQSLEVVDDYTLTMHLKSFNWVMVENYGMLWYFTSPTSFNKAGNGDLSKSKEWAIDNAVGTGPYTVSDFNRDTVIKFTKNPSYWQPGKPYLDGIEIRYIPDPVTAAAMMKAGQADMWMDVSDVQSLLDLQKNGFKINQGPGMFFALLFDSASPDSMFANKLVREAVEYAIDRPTIAKMLGQGLYEPLHEMAAEISPFYIKDYDPRPYNPDKAKELLKQAGYPNGFKTTILLSDSPSGRDAVASLQDYLGKVGIIVEPDVADLGRYFGAAFGTGWKNMMFGASGINPSGTDVYTHYGPRPVTYKTKVIYKSPEYLAKCEAGLDPKFKVSTDAMPTIKEAIKQAGEDAMLVPLWRTPNSAIMAPYVHSDYFLVHGVVWYMYDDWMEKH